MSKKKISVLKTIFVIFILIILFTITGCEILPPPASAIKPPQYSKFSLDGIDDPKAIARRFLLPGTQFAYPINPRGKDAVHVIDLEGDGRSELLVLYRGVDSKNGSEQHGVFILKEGKDGRWGRYWESPQVTNIIAMDWADVIDITGDGRKELLLGWSLGFEVGSHLEIYSLKAKPEPRRISRIKYDELEIRDLPGAENERIPEFIVRIRDREREGEARQELRYILRWSESSRGLVPAEDVYPMYYKGIVEELELKVSGYEREYYDWYILADAQLKAGLPGDAINSSKKALELIDKYVERIGTEKNIEMYRTKVIIILGEAYIKAGKYLEGKAILDNIYIGYRSSDSKTRKYSSEDFSRVCLYLGRAFIGIGEYENAKNRLGEALKIIEALYPKDIKRELYILNSYAALKELEYIEPFLEEDE
ncbi:MAG: hypothetical protein ACOYWZ_23535 [Bacillota bacterium]